MESKLVLLDFWAPWCNPCKLMNPVIDEIEKEFPNLKVERINVDENSALVDKYGIKTVPTYLLEKDGEIVATVIGAMPKYRFMKELTLNKE